MASGSSILLKLLITQCLVVVCVSEGYDFFYFAQQWPGAICDSKEGCCFPTSGKPAQNFNILGLWPYRIDGSSPTYCNNSHNHFKKSKMYPDLLSRMHVSWPSLACPSSDGFKLWSDEWDKYGSCSQDALDQPAYFQAALNLRDKIDLLRILKKSGIKPNNGKLYSLLDVKVAVKKAVGYEPGVYCDWDKLGGSGMLQLRKIYLCVDPAGSKVIDCPGLPEELPGCPFSFKFSPF